VHFEGVAPDQNVSQRTKHPGNARDQGNSHKALTEADVAGGEEGAVGEEGVFA
jgi:hypothetical protein